MAEIKSTLELAMERTKNLAISGEEREEIKHKEILQKATGLFHRYTEGSLSLKEVEKETGKLEEKTGRRVREMLLSQWTEALSLNGENERLLMGIEFLKGRKVDPWRERLDDLVSRYRQEKERAEEEARDRGVAALRREGIYGSAVDPRVEGDPLWEKERTRLDRQYGIELEKVKEQFIRKGDRAGGAGRWE